MYMIEISLAVCTNPLDTKSGVNFSKREVRCLIGDVLCQTFTSSMFSQVRTGWSVASGLQYEYEGSCRLPEECGYTPPGHVSLGFPYYLDNFPCNVDEGPMMQAPRVGWDDKYSTSMKTLPSHGFGSPEFLSFNWLKYSGQVPFLVKIFNKHQHVRIYSSFCRTRCRPS